MNNRPEWMWANALQALARAEHLHRHFFHPVGGSAPAWEPPLDVLETDQEVVVIAALPGVPPDGMNVRIEGAQLVISGERPLPKAFQHAVIHRMELPQGRFERRVPLPHGLYRAPTVTMADGCLVISLGKAG